MESEDEISIKWIGDDSPPLMNLVPEAPPSHWGKITSQGRTCSQDYLRFLHGGLKCQTNKCRKNSGPDCPCSKS